MKVLYIGYYKQKDEWGRQACNNMLALEKVGVDVACRSFDLTETETPQCVAHLEAKTVDDADYCIQHLFPDHMVGTDKFKKNVAFFANECMDLSHSPWMEQLNMMDDIWVSNNMLGGIHSGCLMPNALDTSVYKKRYRPLSIPSADATFKLYTMTDGVDLTGLEWVVAAFHSEFDPWENATLLIQIKSGGDKEVKAVEELCTRVKTTLNVLPNIQDYKKDVIISSKEMDQSHYFELHQYGDCYVTSSRDVSGDPAEFDAAGFGCGCIVTEGSRLARIYGDEFDITNMHPHIPTVYETRLGAKGPFPGIGTGRDYVVRPDALRMKAVMRKEFHRYSVNPVIYKPESKSMAEEMLEQISLESVGKFMKDRLNDA